MEKKKKPTEKKPALGGSNPFNQPDEQHATVCCGLYQERLPVAGKTIAQIRDEFGGRLDIADEAIATVAGKEVDNNYRVGSNEVLMFIQQAGEKGQEWSGSLCDDDPDNCWIDDETGEHVNAWTGERTMNHPTDNQS